MTFNIQNNYNTYRFDGHKVMLLLPLSTPCLCAIVDPTLGWLLCKPFHLQLLTPVTLVIVCTCPSQTGEGTMAGCHLAAGFLKPLL